VDGAGSGGQDVAADGSGDVDGPAAAAERERLLLADAAADGLCPLVVAGEATAILLGTMWMNLRGSHCGRCGSLVGVLFSLYRGGDSLWFPQYLSCRWAAFSKRTRRALLPGAVGDGRGGGGGGDPRRPVGGRS